MAAQIDLQLSDVFAKTEILLDGNRAPGVRTQETNLGDFAADAILWSANQATGGNIDGAITTGGIGINCKGRYYYERYEDRIPIWQYDFYCKSNRKPVARGARGIS